MRLGILVAATLTLAASPAMASEVTLFDRYGSPAAYIATEEDPTIYLWDGTPTAYLVQSSIYGFNGAHLGWYEQGVVRDHEGSVAGFIRGAIDLPTRVETVKGAKQVKPVKSVKELAPSRPPDSAAWSREDLTRLLLAGAGE